MKYKDDYAVKVEGLRKCYGPHPVLKGLDFQIRRGEIFGLIGINGAGKTTALECMEGFRRYDGGRICVNGRIGVQLQSASLPAYMKAMEAVRLFAAWKQTKPDPSVLSALEISRLQKKNYGELSTGQKQRLHLALALTGDPEILILDEPAAGLDVEGRTALHGLIRSMRDRGKTILLTSHDMAEVEELCDRIAVLHRGMLVFTGTARELTEKAGGRYQIRITTEEGEVSCTADNISETLLALLTEYKQQNRTVLDIQISRGSLEQHLLRIARGG